MSKTLVKVGHGDHGKRMSLADFDTAEPQEGRLYELNKGVIVVSDVPKRKHTAQVVSIRTQIMAYDSAHEGVIFKLLAGSECKILLSELESERHPDLAIYKTSWADHDESTLWTTWIPELAIEVVSPGSEDRDYVDKRDEYFRFGVAEYWIVDAAPQQILVLRRAGGRWREQVVRPGEKLTTRLLPDFSLDVAAVFEAANQFAD